MSNISCWNAHAKTRSIGETLVFDTLFATNYGWDQQEDIVFTVFICLPSGWYSCELEYEKYCDQSSYIKLFIGCTCTFNYLMNKDSKDGIRSHISPLYCIVKLISLLL